MTTRRDHLKGLLGMAAVGGMGGMSSTAYAADAKKKADKPVPPNGIGKSGMQLADADIGCDKVCHLHLLLDLCFSTRLAG